MNMNTLMNVENTTDRKNIDSHKRYMILCVAYFCEKADSIEEERGTVWRYKKLA